MGISPEFCKLLTSSGCTFAEFSHLNRLLPAAGQYEPGIQKRLISDQPWITWVNPALTMVFSLVIGGLR
ncbi:MAG: hypothetical protein U5K27_02860 [Desulfotignum sp.]|nr:hypothetical protein [Desulfotignum sp.]